uniref:uncharacterized protein LOC120341335 n=1 Tax=Styela clava TaxID=7725 RepID=UPI001939FE6E|nr:uncharacterized protein LOC120341335 [Styela clava]
MMFKLSKWKAKLLRTSQCCQANYAMFHYSSLLSQNHYQILGIKQTATQSEVKQAYFKLCKEYHPDKHSNNKVKAQQFLKISDAYTVLSNTVTRKEYDDKLGRRRSFDTVHEREAWSSAYRNNPYVNRQQHWEYYQRPPYRDPHDRYTRTQRNEWRHETNYNQHSRDRLTNYWFHYYRQRGHSAGKVNLNSNQNPDVLMKVFVICILGLLSFRFFVAFKISRNRTDIDKWEGTELIKHRKILREPSDSDKPQTEFSDCVNIAHPKLEDA